MLPNGQPAMPMARPGMYPAGAARSVVMPSGPYPAAPYPPQAVPMMPMASGAQSVVGAPYPAVPYPMSQVGVGMMGMPMMGFVDPYEFDDSASVRARNSLAMAWLEREREKERQRQHERQLEQQMPAFAPPSAAALQAFPQMANMPPVLPGSVVFIPGYGYVQQPQPSSQQNGMWSGIISAYGSVAPSARPSRPSSNAGSVRSFTSQMQANRTRATKSRQVSVAAPTIGEGDNDEDVPLHTLPRQASAVAGIGANGQKADANPSSSARVLPRSKIQPPSASYHQAALQVPVSKVAGGSPKPAAKQ